MNRQFVDFNLISIGDKIPFDIGYRGRNLDHSHEDVVDDINGRYTLDGETHVLQLVVETTNFKEDSLYEIEFEIFLRKYCKETGLEKEFEFNASNADQRLYNMQLTN